MRIYTTKADQIRQLLQDPLFSEQSLSKIARFVDADYRAVTKTYRDLLAAGKVKPRPKQRGNIEAAVARQREPEIIALLMDPAWADRPLHELASALGLPMVSVRTRYRLLVKEGVIPKRRSGVPKGVYAQGRKSPRPAARRTAWPHSSSG